MMVYFPKLMASRPSAFAAKHVRRAFAITALTYVGGTILVVTGAGVGSLLIMRRVREEYRLQALENVKMMVEGTLSDHQNRPNGESE